MMQVLEPPTTELVDTPTNHQNSNGGGSPEDNIVSELESENTDTESDSTQNPRGGPYKLRPNPNPNYSSDFRY